MIIKLKQKSTMSNFTNTVMYEYAKYIFVFSNTNADFKNRIWVSSLIFFSFRKSITCKTHVISNNYE